VRPDWVVVSVGAGNGYGHMHAQAKAAYRHAGDPWYRTDRNGTITIRSPGTPGGGYVMTVDSGAAGMSGPADRRSTQPECAVRAPRRRPDRSTPHP